MAGENDTNPGSTNEPPCPSRGTGVSPVQNQPDASATGMGPVDVRRGANLPHWTRESGVYSVTFRLHDSLPPEVVEWLRLRQRAACDPRGNEPDQNDAADHHLGRGRGSCWLRNGQVANLVQSSLLHFHAQRYDLMAWCVMPNHVHAIVRPWPGHGLPRIMHAWKSYTAHEANKLLDRTGPFWQEEAYDHLIRDGTDLDRCLEYVRRNPEEAGLGPWPWCGATIEFASDINPHGRDAHATSD